MFHPMTPPLGLLSFEDILLRNDTLMLVYLLELVAGLGRVLDGPVAPWLWDWHPPIIKFWGHVEGLGLVDSIEGFY